MTRSRCRARKLWSSQCGMSRLEYAMLSEAGLGYEAAPFRKRRRAPKDDPPAEYSADATEYRAPSAADDFLAWSEYSKEPGQRTDAPLPGLDGPPRRYPAAATVQPDSEPVAPPPPVPTGVLDARPWGRADTDPDWDASSAGYDVAMYMFTGIMLILVLEQFVQMGVAMRPSVAAAGSW